MKNLHEIDQQHYIDFLDSKSDTTLDYRRGIETNLRLLQEGLNKRAERFNKPLTHFCTENRLIESRGRLEGVSDRSYTQDDIESIKSVVSDSVANSVSLMQNLGLRVSESVSLRKEHIKGDYIRIEDDNVTKGGRDRVIPIPANYRSQLAEMTKSLEANEKIVELSAGTVQNAVKSACDQLNIKSNGTHGFRHTYARERVDQLMNPAEKNLFSKCMERYAEGKKFDYGVYNRDLYDSMKIKMDQVHFELGHGKDRFDLAVRYMR